MALYNQTLFIFPKIGGEQWGDSHRWGTLRALYPRGEPVTLARLTLRELLPYGGRGLVETNMVYQALPQCGDDGTGHIGLCGAIFQTFTSPFVQQICKEYSPSLKQKLDSF